jgi:hypothetical protein
MLSFLAAAALMQPAAAQPAPHPDLRCMAAYLFAVGQMTDDPKSTEEEKAGATSVVMYFFGKVRARTANSDIKSEIKGLVETPGYLDQHLKADIDRCGEEFTARGKELEAFGE